MPTDEKTGCADTNIVVVQQDKDGTVLGRSLPTRDFGVATNLQAIVGLENSYLEISGEDDSCREKK